MRITLKPVAVLLLPVLLVSSTAFAGQQSRVVDGDTLRQALAAHAGAEQEQRDSVRRVLGRDDVRQIADRMGLDVAQASAAVGTLSGADLTEAAERAGAVESALAGGVTTIAISVTTLLLILIIVILLAK
jgi:hypothetical protein